VGVGLLVVGAVAVGVAWGWGALAIYAFFTAIAGLLVFAARLGGDWVRDASRGRFGRDDDRRR
jgi:hypothetical protein